MISTSTSRIVLNLTFVLSLLVFSTVSQAITASAAFSDGAIAEYTTNAHQPQNLIAFSSLGIIGATITQDSDDGAFGGSQGNDYAVGVTFRYSDGSAKTFNAAVNWRDTQGSTLIGIGLTVASPVDDGSSYSLTPGSSKTYVLRADGNLYADGDSVSGNAATNGLLTALNSYVTSTIPVITLTGANPQSIELGTAYSELGATASDNTDGDITGNIVIDVSAVDVNTLGDYTVTYNVDDAAGNPAVSVMRTVTVVDTTAATITTSAVVASVYEGEINLGAVSADESVTWSISDAGFSINSDGVITLDAEADYETATFHTFTVTAEDAVSNKSNVTLTVTVIDKDEDAPLISGPSGTAGDVSAKISMNENQTDIAIFTANETVSWSLSGTDADLFAINTSSGALTFKTTLDYENPNDANQDNSYIAVITATDTVANTSSQTVTVIILDLEEVLSRLNEIEVKLKEGLQHYVSQSLGDSIAYNESILRGSRNKCQTGGASPLQLKLSPNQNSARAQLNYKNQLHECESKYRIYSDASIISSDSIKSGKDIVSRGFGSITIETDIDDKSVIGVGVKSSFADGNVAGFENSKIDDRNVELHSYFIRDFNEDFRGGFFISKGTTSYSFSIADDDGFDLNGKMKGKRDILGFMLSGDFTINSQEFTTDVIYSDAKERIGNANIKAEYLGEINNAISFYVGSVDSSRLSFPINTNIIFKRDNEKERIISSGDFSFGALCEDNLAYTSGFECGYQFGLKLKRNFNTNYKDFFFVDYNYEVINGQKRERIGLGMQNNIGKSKKLRVGTSIGFNEDHFLAFSSININFSSPL